MRILQVHTRYRQPGGEDAVVRAEAELLRSGGHSVVQWQTQNPQGALAAAGALGLSAWNPFAARTLRAVAERHRPDVAHVHNTWFAVSPSAVRTLHRSRTPVVMTLHNYRLMCSNGLLFRDGRPCQDCVGTHPWHGVQHRCYRNSVAASSAAAATIALHSALRTWEGSVDLFLALTDFAKRRFVAGGLPADKIKVKPHFVPDPGERAMPPSASPTVLYVGRLSHEKGVDLLLDAWSALGSVGLELVLVGDGPLRSRLEARRVPRVRFLGQVPAGQVRRLMSAARALVFPSIWYETFGLVMVEALAAGLPVVASDLGGSGEVIGRQSLVPADDARAWKEALAGLGDDEWVDAAGRRGRLRYRERFTPTAGLTGLEEAYRAVLR